MKGLHLASKDAYFKTWREVCDLATAGELPSMAELDRGVPFEWPITGPAPATDAASS